MDEQYETPGPDDADAPVGGDDEQFDEAAREEEEAVRAFVQGEVADAEAQANAEAALDAPEPVEPDEYVDPEDILDSPPVATEYPADDPRSPDYAGPNPGLAEREQHGI